MKISNFKISEYFIREFLKQYNLDFSDLDLCFHNKEPCLLDGKIFLLSNKDSKISQVLFQIVSIYIYNVEEISQSKNKIELKDKSNFLNLVLSVLRDMTYNTYSEYKLESKTILSEFPSVWLVLKHLICPAFNVPAKNIPIKFLYNQNLDCVVYIDKPEVLDLEEECIIVNSSINNYTYIVGFLLSESIKSIGIDPSFAYHNIFSRDELKKKLIGILSLEFDEEDLETILSIITCNTYVNTEIVKTAQSINQSWWYIGLIEKMLEPTRGSDWRIYQSEQEDAKELWEKIEKEKKKLGLDPLPYESLLRLQSEDYKGDPNKTIQGLLSDVRVW